MRIRSLDYGKGVGVVSFIVWHSYAYYYVGNARGSPIGRAVVYVTGLFIFLSGVVIGWHYADKMRETKQRITIFVCLMLRALKLVAYVLAANVLENLLQSHSLTGATFFTPALNVLSLLWKDRWDVPLQVLAVIGLGILLDYGLMVMLLANRRIAFQVLLLALTAYFAIDIVYSGHFPYLWRYGVLSVLGMLFGMEMLSQRSPSFREPLFRSLVIVGIVMCGVAALSVRLYEIILMEAYLYSLLVVSLSLGFGYYLYQTIDKKEHIGVSTNVLITLGEQSLLIYLLQIVIIKLSVITRIVLPNSLTSNFQVLVLALSVCVLCVAFAVTVKLLRRDRYFESVYRFLF